MNYTIDLKNADEAIIEDIKAMLKMNSSIEFKIKKSKSRLDSAIQEVERGEVVTFNNIKEAMEYLNDEN